MADDRTVNLLGALALTLVDSLNSTIVSQLGHSGEAAAALVTLGVEPGVSINQLRQMLKLSHPGTVRLIDRLEAAGWVERRAGADGRTLALFLTPLGQEQRQHLLADRRRQLEPALEQLTETEQQQLAHLLEKMLATLTTSELQAFSICRLCEAEVCPAEDCPVEQVYQQRIQGTPQGADP